MFHYQIGVLWGCQSLRRPRRRFPFWTLPGHVFYDVEAPGPSKTSFYPKFAQNCPRGCRALAADSHDGHLQSTCFTMFKPLGYQKRDVFPSLGRDGSDGQACRVIGPSWPKLALPIGLSARPSKRRPCKLGVTL